MGRLIAADHPLVGAMETGVMVIVVTGKGRSQAAIPDYCHVSPDYVTALAHARALAGEAAIRVLGDPGAVAVALEAQADEIHICVSGPRLGLGTRLFGKGMPGADYFVRTLECDAQGVALHLQRKGGLCQARAGVD